MRGRLTLLLIVAAGLAPATWLHSPPPRLPADSRPLLTIEPLDVNRGTLGEVSVAGAWALSSPNFHFGGYSALLSMPDGSLFAASDSGDMLRFTPPDRAPGPVVMDYFADAHAGEKAVNDIEGLARDPVSGKVWAAYEQSNMIMRHSARLVREAALRVPAMRRWPRNRGAESIVRLADGRFIVLSEGSPRWFAEELPALLFPGDPVSGVRPVRFAFRPPEGFRPVDAALLPDGRVMILLRRMNWALPPTFSTRLMIADPAAIRAGRTWPAEPVADLAEPLPTDNYEGLAVEPSGQGGATLWLISDDNRAKYQRTLLLKLLWRPK